MIIPASGHKKSARVGQPRLVDRRATDLCAKSLSDVLDEANAARRYLVVFDGFNFPAFGLGQNPRASSLSRVATLIFRLSLIFSRDSHSKTVNHTVKLRFERFQHRVGLLCDSIGVEI